MPVIFLSYSSVDTATADVLDNDFFQYGYNLMRDTRDAPYRADLAAFMREAGKADYVMMLLSHDYLVSPYCMEEALELLDTQRFGQRVLPVVLGNAMKVFDHAGERKPYYDLWRDNAEKARLLEQGHSNEDFRRNANKIARIYFRLDDFFLKLTNIVVRPFDALKKENYSSLLNIIGYNPREYHQSLFDQAFQANERRQYAEARTTYEYLLSRFPNDSSSHYNLALLLEDQYRDWQGAKRHYETSISLAPATGHYHEALAGLLTTHFHVSLAGKPLGRTFRFNPKACEDKIDEADGLAKLLAYDFAKRGYEQALSFNPGNARAYNNFAVLLHNHYKDRRKAMEYYETALRLDPDFKLARTNLTRLAMNTSRQNWWEDILRRFS